MTLLTYGLLFLTVVSLWLPKCKGVELWPLVLAFSVVCGLASERLTIVGLIFIGLFFCFVYVASSENTRKSFKFLSSFGVLVLGAFMGLGGVHVLPGFNNLKVLNSVFISSDAVPFSLYLNYDKTAVGIAILGFMHQRISSTSQLFIMIKKMMPLSVGLIFLMMLLSVSMHYVLFDPKLPDSLPLWALINLLFVCTAEEAFFRGFIQKKCFRIFGHLTYGAYLSITIAALLFGLSHFTGGVWYVVLATIAGMGYGYIYHRTKHIEASILAHFLLNTTHFLFFTYPALAL